MNHDKDTQQKKIIVLGAGLVGGPMALDLAMEPHFAVTVADIDGAALAALQKRQPELEVLERDFSDTSRVTELVAGYDLVLNAMPGFMGYSTLQAILAAGRDVVDISFFAEDPFSLQDAAQETGVTAIIDCGVAPGLSNLLVGRVAEQLDQLDSVEIYVGGLPEVRQWPYEYKAVFSPIDVIAEFTRPARYVENGAMVTRPALTDPELIDFPGLGTLEAFNTDGLRSLAHTISSPNMKEKTLRYPGHVEKMAVLRDTGFFDESEIRVGSSVVRPLDVTAALLFPKWKLDPGEVDLTALWVRMAGRLDGQAVRYDYRMLDRYDADSGTHSMARTTGYTATAAIRMLAEGLYREPGIVPPERIGRHRQAYDFMMACLRERGVVLEEEVVSQASVVGRLASGVDTEMQHATEGAP
ncbi:MAG: saccharopine dehydrogenase C-terminal domain-containing protein [Acidobacteriota bacterium]